MKPGDTISHYRIVELLGAGGMGVVYKAEDTRLKRSVALKFLTFALLQDPAAKERLVQEAQAASGLDHPNICTIHEIDETADGQMFLAMAYYDGETLKARIARSPLGVDEAIDVITQMARAVAAAHDAGIIHRDIKPANVVLTRRGEVKLLDFGVAKQLGQTALTRTGTTLGTVAYMPPEQITGGGIDQRSDVWALGVVFYEMLAGGLPFGGEHDAAILHAIASAAPRPLRELRRDVPADAAAVVARALQKDPADRYPSARAFLHAVEALRAPSAGDRSTRVEIAAPRRAGSNRRLVAAAAATLIAVAAIGGWFAYRAERVRTARRTLQQVPELMQKERYSDAYFLLRRLEPVLGRDPEFLKARQDTLLPTPVQTDPPGADLYVKAYADANGDWDRIGQSPLETRGPLGMFRWRITKPGYSPLEVGDASSGVLGGLNFTLSPEGSLPDGMVRVGGGDVALPDGRTVSLPTFFMDRFEVTNRAFKKFVDAGGYRNQTFWTEPFVKNGRTLTWSEAAAELHDATGRPGPATWELGAYPEGEDDFPVRGVSWYEAAAYAKFAGKTLPTVHHWRRAARVTVYSDILAVSNFAGKGPAGVGTYQGIGPFGTYDMAGNVKEWCSNAVGEKRYILGGAWNEPVYMFRASDARAPFDRAGTNGFRTIKIADAARVPTLAFAPIERLFRDYTTAVPVSDALFSTYRSLYSYDRTDLKPVVESVDDSAPDWRIERVTYAAAYDGERITAYLFLPKHGARPPYETLVYFPHSGGTVLRDFQMFEMSYLGFIVKSGHALLLPMFKGFYERRLPAGPRGPNETRDLTIKQVKDIGRSVDYLLTRQDVDPERLAFFGVSTGVALGTIGLAIEPRFKVAVFWSGGFPITKRLPEYDLINFAPHITTPVLMLNGRDDFTNPIETSQLPMIRFLGPPDTDKRHVLYDGGHVFPFARVEKDTLDWLDRYLGAPK